ncbi:MAG TPA: A/G-specific adenine glycosylase [bacterium]|nr:A/G-specific adenine glycosylase [bacterium]
MPLDLPTLRRPLLRWYAAAKRDLPWRRTLDPYSILVSELMLQQTQVKTALPYYEKFLKRFPTAKALAAATEEQVLAAWAGLGYYRRARFLHAAAKAVTAAGAFPSTIEGIRELPGVGAYTAAAVGSICFNLPAAVVDGNVIRVLARLLALEADPTKGGGAQAIKDTAQAFLDPNHPGDFNQAMMELGASLCSPTKPQCPACPLKGQCAAFLAHKAEDFPKLPERAEGKVLYKSVVLAVRGKGAKLQVLAQPRKLAKGAAKAKAAEAGRAADRLQGLWSFPEVEITEGGLEMAEAAALKEARRLLGKQTDVAGRLGKHRHNITIYDIHLWPFWFRDEGGMDMKGGWEWVGIAALEKKPLASAEKKLLGLLKDALEPGREEQGQLGLKI